ncbi:probable cytokinin riboside 5'-monophosphate phosphoribohydrolase LOGL10 isoform X2 [Prunus dulcis]|uniref:probable cytokinin riboside 5'-monophosphate phosphoribohydrolase LOGL10 isoform X2 n=1 Tax=Prunus dulcis TaxID=3755 RepID=UPI0014839282|nr:probable cytokinin riboside 5'-monophosphate phosphoribohydrolase LOGL10 isoform X2 [Prunus dulcis]
MREQAQMRKEIERCYELIHRLGRGVVYLGSSRMGPDHSHYLQALELGREIANLLECTSWTGAGPGLMDAATKGALQAGKPVGGFKIGKEAGEWTASNFHPYLPSEVYLTCRFFSARKHGLVDAAVRSCSSDRTAVVALPGGIGTLDEIFEILALIQLERIGSELPVPFLLMNYDSFYSKLLGFLDDCEDWGTLSKGEITSLWKVCDSNSEALAYLADFYKLPPPTDKAQHDNELQSASGTFS